MVMAISNSNNLCLYAWLHVKFQYGAHYIEYVFKLFNCEYCLKPFHQLWGHFVSVEGVLQISSISLFILKFKVLTSNKANDLCFFRSLLPYLIQLSDTLKSGDMIFQSRLDGLFNLSKWHYHIFKEAQYRGPRFQKHLMSNISKQPNDLFPCVEGRF